MTELQCDKVHWTTCNDDDDDDDPSFIIIMNSALIGSKHIHMWIHKKKGAYSASILSVSRGVSTPNEGCDDALHTKHLDRCNTSRYRER